VALIPSSAKSMAGVPVRNRPLDAAATSAGKSLSAKVSPKALYVPSEVKTLTRPSMSPWAMVTA
jgi:hypothetical protein